MLRQVDYEKPYEKQEITKEVSSLDHPLKLYFLREGGYLHFSFEGFGDLFGHQLTMSHEGSTIAAAFINHNGDATICVEHEWLPTNFRLTISPAPVG